MSALQSIAMDLYFFHKENDQHLSWEDLDMKLSRIQDRFQNLPSQYVRDQNMLVDIFLIANKIEDGLLDGLTEIEDEDGNLLVDDATLLHYHSILNAIADLFIAYRHICDEELVGN